MSDVCSSCSLYARCRCAGPFSDGRGTAPAPTVGASLPGGGVPPAATGGTVRGPRVVPPVSVGHTNRGGGGFEAGTRDGREAPTWSALTGAPSTPVLFELRSGRRWRRGRAAIGRVLDRVWADR